MTNKQKKMRNRLILSAILYAVIVVLEYTDLLSFIPDKGPFVLVMPVLFFIPYITAAYDILIKAVKNIAHGQIFDECFLMILATIGAYGTGEYSEAVAVVILYQIGELFQSYAVGKSRNSISELMSICPEYANIESGDGFEQVDPEDVETGSIILVRPGEKIPIDSIVVEGESYIDTAALTGESVPRRVSVNDSVFSGCVNGAGTLKCRTIKAFEDSTVSKILELVENASSKKSRTENFITKFAKYYTPAVTIAAVLLALIPSVVVGNPGEWIRRACTFLVISCPCALVISVPLGFFSGIGAASKAGILVKGSNFLEAVSRAKIVCFDKTGTITKGCFEVTKIYEAGGDSDEILELAAGCELYSSHPIAAAIVKACDRGFTKAEPQTVKEYAGMGISADISGKTVYVGNEKLMNAFGFTCIHVEDAGTVCHVACDENYYGAIVIADVLKDNIREDLAAVRDAGIRQCVMLTGDSEKVAKKVAAESGIDTYYGELFPADKVEKVEELQKTLTDSEMLAFVGDGINDAPVLARADVGIAMGAIGSDSAIEAADIVLMDDNIGKIATVINIARKTLRIVKQNIVLALGVKALVLILGAFGLADMWLAVFADVGVAFLAIINSMRAMLNSRH